MHTQPTKAISIAKNITGQESKMQRYYAFHALIYDATRWSFLFGRKHLIDSLPLDKHSQRLVMEIGCGTGYNLQRIARRYPQANLLGLDTASPMIAEARKKLAPLKTRAKLLHTPYRTDHNLALPHPPQVILFSYSLTMINPQWQELLAQAYRDLAPGGYIAVVDFHETPSQWFRVWMQRNHVRMESHLLPYLTAHFDTVHAEVRPAYGGLWQYFSYIGQKNA